MHCHSHLGQNARSKLRELAGEFADVGDQIIRDAQKANGAVSPLYRELGDRNALLSWGLNEALKQLQKHDGFLPTICLVGRRKIWKLLCAELTSDQLSRLQTNLSLAALLRYAGIPGYVAMCECWSARNLPGTNPELFGIRASERPDRIETVCIAAATRQGWTATVAETVRGRSGKVVELREFEPGEMVQPTNPVFANLFSPAELLAAAAGVSVC